MGNHNLLPTKHPLHRTRGAATQGSRARKLTLAFCLATLLAAVDVAVPADQLEKAAQLEKGGQTDQAAQLYMSWLASNKPGAEWERVLLHAVDLLPDPTATVALLEESIPKLRSPDALHAAYLALAHFEELLGDIPAAQTAYQNASLVPGPKDFRSLLDSANALFQLGQAARAAAQARVVLQTCQDPSLLTQAKVLLARTMAAAGQGSAARAEIEDLLSADSKPLLGPSELLQIYQTCGDLGFSDLQARAADLLGKFSKSPEYLVLVGKAEQYPSPSRILGFHDAPYLAAVPGAEVEGRSPEPATAPAGSPPPAAAPPGGGESAVPAPRPAPHQNGSGIVTIQIGSYLDRTNAEYRVKDLEEAGFRGEIVEAQLGRTTYYRVVVPDIPPAKSQLELVRLKEKGFEGFLLFN